MSKDESTGIEAFVNWTSTKREHPFYHFEPWDGPKGKAPKHNPAGARFQTAMMKSIAKIRMAMGGNQIGKSIARCIEVIIQITGEMPYCFRFPLGADTGIKRIVSENNIRRWGRRDIATDKILDHNIKALENDTWDCGNIIGVGDYPREKICEDRNGQIWICTYKQARDVVWLDMFRDFIPEHCLDKTKGVDGFSKSDMVFYINDKKKTIRFITYEQGWERTEAKKAWEIVLDEEPPDRKFFTGCLMHAHFISFSFTPLRGMSWSYTDVYQKAIDGDPSIELFHATKYDCPYADAEDIAHEERHLKDFERDAKIYGRYSQQEGRPYYDYELCQKYLARYAPTGTLSEIMPIKSCDTVKEVIKTQMKMFASTERSPSTWEIYEDVKTDQAYWFSADCAKGNDDPELAQDKSSGYIFRNPNELHGEYYPVCVAALHTTDVVENFARLSLYGALYYNMCLMAPETKGSDGSAFLAEIRDYPNLFKMTVTRQKDRKVTENIGFDTNERTRTAMFNKLRKQINTFEESIVYKHYPLLIEMSKLIWKKGRPDHPNQGTSDCIVAWCIGLWVYEESPEQIRNYRSMRKSMNGDVSLFELFLTKERTSETKPVLGSSTGMDTRSKNKCRRGTDDNSMMTSRMF